MIQIDKNKPLPRPRSKWAKLRQAVEEMQVGDSALFHSYIETMAAYKVLKKKFNQAAMRKEGAAWRVWRLE